MPNDQTVRYREMLLQADARTDGVRAAAEDGRIPVSFSSETPVERYDWWNDETFMEVLDHSPDAVDLSYARDGLPFFVAHEDGDMVGLVEDVTIGPDKVGRGMLKPSRSQRGQEIVRDILDGIRKKTSVRYTWDENAVTRTQGPNDRFPTVILHRWKPLEVSSVPIPADYTVGVERSASLVAQRAAHLSRRAARQAEEHAMPESTTAAPASHGASVTVGDDVQMRNVSQLAELHGMQDIFARGISAGKSANDIQADMIAETRKRLEKGPTIRPPVTLTEKEEKEYSLVRAILASAENEESFEMEVSKEIGRALGKPSDKGFYFPTNIRGHLPAGANPLYPRYGARAGLDATNSTKGVETVFDTPGTFIDLLRHRTRVLQAGATMLSGLNGPVTFVKQNGAATAYWKPENAGTDVTDSNILFTTVSLTPYSLVGTTSFSRELLRQSVIAIENTVRSDLSAVHALAIDLAALNGSGTAQPLGVLNNTNVNAVALGTNGAAPTYISIVQMEEEVEKDDADIGSGAYITTPSVKRKLKTTQTFPTSNGIAIWSGGIDGQVNGYPAFSTNQMPSNLTKGTSTTVCHGIAFGYWANLMIGEWGAMEIIVDPYRLKKQGMIELTSFQMTNLAYKYAQAFCITTDATP